MFEHRSTTHKQMEGVKIPYFDNGGIELKPGKGFST